MRALKAALFFALGVHALGLCSMLLLLPALPGGLNPEVAARMGYVAAHPWALRLGWFPWQLCALADLGLSIALRRLPPRDAGAPGPDRWLGGLTLLATVVGIVLDQRGQIAWGTEGIRLAQAGQLAPYQAFEAGALRAIGVFGALFYDLAAVGWSVILARAGLWSRRLTLGSTALFGLLGALAFAGLLPSTCRLPALEAGLSGLAFTALLIWFAAVTRRVARSP